MIPADLAVVGIAELATPEGTKPLAGPEAGRLRVVREAAVACRDGVVAFAGPEAEYRERVALLPGARVVDARGGTVLPGFVDAHTHLPFAGWRESEFDERRRGASYSEIAARGGGILSTVRVTRAASRAELASAVRRRLDDVLAWGTTTVEAKSGYGLSRDDELKQLEALRDAAPGHPVQLVRTFLGAHAMPVEWRSDREGWIRILVDQLLPEVARSRLAEYADAFVDAHAFSPGEARRVLEAARSHGLGIRLHADQLADDGGARLAAELGAASADHLEHASDEGLEAMARAGVSGVLLPAATFFLGMEARPPGRRLVEAGVPVVVATDFNPGTCPMESMGVALAFSSLYGQLAVDEAIVGATLNAACSLGRGAETGSLETGRRADLVVHAVPNRYHLVYRFGLPRVDTVIAGGRVVVERGRLVEPASG
jgi:imidazolonepropionase